MVAFKKLADERSLPDSGIRTVSSTIQHDSNGVVSVPVAAREADAWAVAVEIRESETARLVS